MSPAPFWVKCLQAYSYNRGKYRYWIQRRAESAKDTASTVKATLRPNSAASNDGFAIAEQDLRIRGPGEFLGERQSGKLALRYADVFDEDLLRQAREAAEAIPEDAARAHVERWYGSKRDLLDA